MKVVVALAGLVIALLALPAVAQTATPPTIPTDTPVPTQAVPTITPVPAPVPPPADINILLPATIGGCSWPLVILILGFLFKRQIGGAIDRLQSLDAGLIKAKLAEAEETISRTEERLDKQERTIADDSMVVGNIGTIEVAKADSDMGEPAPTTNPDVTELATNERTSETKPDTSKAKPQKEEKQDIQNDEDVDTSIEMALGIAQAESRFIARLRQTLPYRQRWRAIALIAPSRAIATASDSVFKLVLEYQQLWQMYEDFRASTEQQSATNELPVFIPQDIVASGMSLSLASNAAIRQASEVTKEQAFQFLALCERLLVTLRRAELPRNFSEFRKRLPPDETTPPTPSKTD